MFCANPHRSSTHRITSDLFGRFQMTRWPDHPMARSPYSPLGTRFNAFFIEPRSVMIFCCSSVIA
jgi:hypothetical protein